MKPGECWRCGEYGWLHKPWCRMPGGCSHCGWDPHRWWCDGPDDALPARKNRPTTTISSYFEVQPA